jgi:hypothetical protein
VTAYATYPVPDSLPAHKLARLLTGKKILFSGTLFLERYDPNSQR